jgi:hypothetical protein
MEENTVEIGLIRFWLGQPHEYMVVTDRSQAAFLNRRGALNCIREFFTRNKKIPIRLLVAPPCKLTQDEVNYATDGRLTEYVIWEIQTDETRIREGPKGGARRPAKDIIPHDAVRLPLTTSSYAFYFHQKEGKTTLYVKTQSYHPGILAIPLDKMEEMIQFLKSEQGDEETREVESRE